MLVLSDNNSFSGIYKKNKQATAYDSNSFSNVYLIFAHVDQISGCIFHCQIQYIFEYLWPFREDKGESFLSSRLRALILVRLWTDWHRHPFTSISFWCIGCNLWYGGNTKKISSSSKSGTGCICHYLNPYWISNDFLKRSVFIQP